MNANRLFDLSRAAEKSAQREVSFHRFTVEIHRVQKLFYRKVLVPGNKVLGSVKKNLGLSFENAVAVFFGKLYSAFALDDVVVNEHQCNHDGDYRQQVLFYKCKYNKPVQFTPEV